MMRREKLRELAEFVVTAGRAYSAGIDLDAMPMSDHERKLVELAKVISDHACAAAARDDCEIREAGPNVVDARARFQATA